MAAFEDSRRSRWWRGCEVGAIGVSWDLFLGGLRVDQFSSSCPGYLCMADPRPSCVVLLGEISPSSKVCPARAERDAESLGRHLKFRDFTLRLGESSFTMTNTFDNSHRPYLH